MQGGLKNLASASASPCQASRLYCRHAQFSAVLRQGQACRQNMSFREVDNNMQVMLTSSDTVPVELSFLNKPSYSSSGIGTFSRVSRMLPGLCRC